MPTRQQVLDLVLQQLDYEDVGRRLGVPAGQAYLIGTGFPADGSDGPAPEDLQRPGLLDGSSQHLVSPGAENPTSKGHVLEWVKAKVLSDRQMTEAFAVRDVEPGEVLEPQEADIFTVLTRDHDQVANLLKQLGAIPSVTKQATPVQLARRKSVVDLITARLSQHEAAEEEMFWPTVRQVLHDGDQLARDAFEQEQQGRDTLAALGKLSSEDERFDELAEELDLRARKHVAFEDKVLLALLEAMSQDDRRALGERFRAAKERAPTRPRPPG